MIAKIYIHQGCGHYVGSTVIVIAESEEDANDLIRERLDEMGLHEEPIDIVEIKNIEINSIVHFNAGDY